MPDPQTLEKAYFIEVANESNKVAVQFNPQTLKLTYANSYSGGDQPMGSSPQFAGTLSTKLTMELWFDVTLAVNPPFDGDVRRMIDQVAYFMRIPRNADPNDKNKVPPNVKFQWGTFAFTGTMDSMDETIDLFSPSGVPLRANVSIALSKHDVDFELSQATGASQSNSVGTSPLAMAQAGGSLQQMAANAGISNWQGVARANGITNPRNLPPGTMVNLSISA